MNISGRTRRERPKGVQRLVLNTYVLAFNALNRGQFDESKEQKLPLGTLVTGDALRRLELMCPSVEFCSDGL